MTPQQIVLIQESWRKVLPISDTAAELFYSRLFALEPSVKPMFKGDLKLLGDAFTEETELAWVAAYGRITALMQGKQLASA